jgi:hypothetical protein
MGRTESLNLKNDYERACGWYDHFNKSEMALFSECTERYAQNMLDTADIVREAMLQQLALLVPRDSAFSHSLALSFLPVSLSFGDCAR